MILKTEQTGVWTATCTNVAVFEIHKRPLPAIPIILIYSPSCCILLNREKPVLQTCAEPSFVSLLHDTGAGNNAKLKQVSAAEKLSPVHFQDTLSAWATGT